MKTNLAMYVTVRNDSGLRSRNGAAIVPMAAQRSTRNFLGRLENAETRMSCGRLCRRDGTPFSLRVAKPKSGSEGQGLKGQTTRCKLGGASGLRPASPRRRSTSAGMEPIQRGGMIGTPRNPNLPVAAGCGRGRVYGRRHDSVEAAASHPAAPAGAATVPCREINDREVGRLNCALPIKTENAGQCVFLRRVLSAERQAFEGGQLRLCCPRRRGRPIRLEPLSTRIRATWSVASWAGERVENTDSIQI